MLTEALEAPEPPEPPEAVTVRLIVALYVPPELLVPGPRWSRLTTDAAALVGMASFVVAFWWDGVVVALFALVLLGLPLLSWIAITTALLFWLIFAAGRAPLHFTWRSPGGWL